MLSGKKRTGREYEVSTPSTKRSKVDNKGNKSRDSWPRKRKLNRKQMNELPAIMNPSFHKAVFQSFWNKKKFGAPVITTNEVESKNKKQKLFECEMRLNNKQNKSQQTIVTSSNFDSKKKAQIDVYQQFNLNYIPFKLLMDKMEPYSFSSKVNLQQIVTQKGEFLKSKTETIVIEPVPLSCNELDIIKLIGNQCNDMIQYIEFERDSDKAIYKKVYVEFNDTQNTNKFVQSLNGKTYRKHKLCATWTANRSNAETFKKQSTYLKAVGFPLDISKNRVLQFLYQHSIEPVNICLICKYSLIPQIFMQFQTISDCVKALESIKTLKYKKNNSKKEYALYWRYSREFEFNEAVNYQKDVKKIHDEIIRSSQCIDVMNVSWDTKEEELKRLFVKCGAIEKMHINHRKDLFPGTAFVQFEEEESSKKAILTLNGYKLNGYNLKVSIHLKQTRDDKKRIKQWYVEQEEDKIRNDQEIKANKAKKKKQRAKRKKLRRAARLLRR